MANEMDKFLSAQSKMNTLAKKQGKSVNLLNIKYRLLNKALGPFYRLTVDVKNAADTAKDVFTTLGEATEKLGKITSKALKPITGVLKAFSQLNTIMIFILGGYALLGVAIFLLTKKFGGGEASLASFQQVMDAGKGVVDAFMGAIGAVIEAIGGLDFSSVAGMFIPMLETVFVFLGNIITLYFTLIAAIFTGIADIVTRMAEEGMLQRIVDAFGVFFGLVGASLGIITSALSDTGMTMGGMISGIQNLISGIVSFLFNSGIIEFAVKVIEYIAFFAGVIAVVAASLIAIFIRVWGTLGPPLIRFVSAFFAFLAPIIRIVLGILGLIMDGIMALIMWLAPYFEVAMEAIMEILQPILDAISYIIDGVATAVNIGADAADGVADYFGFADGGVSSGPSSGYPVTLHGTEAVVPLPDGRSIPVSIKGDAGGNGSQTNNISINVSGGGNAKEIARAVSDEVSKVMRNRSRGGNYTRGVM
jgi:phage-related protein